MPGQEGKKASGRRLAQALERLEAFYGDVKPALTFTSPYELLVAVMLSAQCTDKRVNIVTSDLFRRYNTPEAMLTLTAKELEDKIRTCGLSPTKSKNILATSKIIVEQYDSKGSRYHRGAANAARRREKDGERGRIRRLRHSRNRRGTHMYSAYRTASGSRTRKTWRRPSSSSKR